MVFDPSKTKTNLIRVSWDRLSRLPAGKLAFSRLVGRLAPYTGSIGAHVLELSAGYARVELRDRKAVRNHLRSVHAIALANLAEVCSGLALMYSVDDHTRGILKGLSIEYLKKARGTLHAVARFDPPAAGSAGDFEVEALLSNADGTVVARARAHWLLGPK
ncbi:MAG: DUF4442 domain-containing protein [Deltaproteobacteria bacterium]|nr:DUF4442 domain-containing protein [Deltaproteobacteria bacterium]